MRWWIGIVALVGLAGPASAQVVNNPTRVIFSCPDHATDDQHEIDIVDNVSGLVVQTILGGDPPVDADNRVVVTINVQPVKFGAYTVVVRAVAGALKSANSLPSDIWFRVPGQPGKPATAGQ